jgi:hypothetical protein
MDYVHFPKINKDKFEMLKKCYYILILRICHLDIDLLLVLTKSIAC